MHFFTDYIQPLTTWLYAHPQWALFITFLISFSESLAIIGSIVPGSVTMTAIGILAGSGVMRIDLTYVAAILGAIAGDSGSYALGYILSDRITNTWPFSNYPNLMNYGKDFFSRYGSTSILIGRFVGPVRSIIPVIAGMMHMKQWYFLSANVLSAIGWSLLYVTPGVLIGAASNELSPESTTRFFIVIFIFLAAIWTFSLAIKWFIIHSRRFLHDHLHKFWSWLKIQPSLANTVKFLTPNNEKNHYPTAAIVTIFLLSLILSTLILALMIQKEWFATTNNYVYLFFQSMGTKSLDAFFITISLMVSPAPILCLFVVFLLDAAYYHHWRLLRSWLSLLVITCITLLCLSFFIEPPQLSSPLLPMISLTLATSLFVFFILYSYTQKQTVFLIILRISLIILLPLGGLAHVYLGDNLIANVLFAYLVGLTICLAHWILYRRHSLVQKHSQLSIFLSFLLYAVAIIVAYSSHFNKMIHIHERHLAQYVLTDEVWWHQQRPLLPVYSTNRIGQRTGILNIQYLGSVQTLQQRLETAGWKRQPSAFFYSLLMRAGEPKSINEFPFMAQLYHNLKPTIVMTFNPGNNQGVFMLRLWRSNYHLLGYPDPIWLGSLSELGQKRGDDETYIRRALSGFKFTQMILPYKYLQALSRPVSPIILLIKEQGDAPPSP